MAILESVKKLAEKLGAETNGRDITDQLNKINKHLDSAGSSNIAEAVSKFADANSGGSGVGFQLMNLSMGGQDEDLTRGTTYINNDSVTVDLSTIFSTNSSHDVVIINPIDELRVTSLESFGDGYTIYFVPTQNCKVYEDSTELDLNDIFQSQQTPSGPTVYEPNGVKVHKLEGNYSPYDGKVRKLYDNGGSMYLTIE